MEPVDVEAVLPATEEVHVTDVGRHRSDMLRALAGFLVVFLPAFIVGEADPGRPERWLFRSVNHLPGSLTAPLVGIMQAGALAAVAVVAFGALALRRRSLARAFLVGGAVAWSAAKLLAFIVRRKAPDELIDQIVLRGHPVATTVFPSTHAAVAAALAIAAMPYVGRFGRRASAVVVLFVGLSRLFVGAQFPIDVVAGWGVGVVVGSLVHLVWGSPHRRPSNAFVESLVARSGLVAASAVPIADHGVPTFAVTTASTPVMVRIFGRDEDLGWFYRLWRLMAFREIDDQLPFRSPADRARQYVTVSLLAERADLCSPRYIDLIDARDDRTAVVTTAPVGVPVAELRPDQRTDLLLTAVWSELARLHDAGVVHRGIRHTSITVDAKGRPCFNDLIASEPSRDPDLRRHDIAALLVVLAALTSAQRAVASAVDSLGPDAIGASLPLLQPLTLTSATRRDLKPHPTLLNSVRAEVGERTGVASPKPIPAARVAVRNLAVLVLAAIAVNLLLAQFGRARQTVTVLRSPHWPWVAVVVVASLVSFVMAAAAATGSTPLRLAPGRTFLVQLAAAFTNRLAPGGLGGMATNARYLERAGASRANAAGSVAVSALAGSVVHAGALIAVTPSLGSVTRGVGDLPDYWLILVIVVGVLALAGVLAAVRLAPRGVRVVRDAIGNLRDVFKQPRKAMLLFGGKLGIKLAYAGALAAAMYAFGATPTVVDVLVVFLAGSALAAASPTPGGLGALEAALIAGFTRIGVPASSAVAGVLCYRLVTYWLPVLPGFLSFRFLRRCAAI